MRITHSLKVSIVKNQNLIIEGCFPLENVASFLQLCLAPIVLIFQELLNYDNIDKEKRQKLLEDFFKNTKSFILKSGFNYKNNFDTIVESLGIENS